VSPGAGPGHDGKDKNSCTVLKYFPLYFVTYPPFRGVFQMNVADLK